MSDAPAVPFETEPGWYAVLTVRRRLGGRWSLALVGALLILHGGGLLFSWSPTRTVLDLIYPNQDPPGIETRDMGWATMFLIVGVILVVWTCVRLVSRRPVLRADGDGLALAVRGPFRRAVTVPWSEVDSVSATTVSDDYGDVPALLIRLVDPSRIGPNPWGARWMEPSTLSVSAPDWKQHPQRVAERLQEVGAIGARPPAEEVGPDPSPLEVTGDPVADAPSEGGDA
ncbi:MAG: hypothetical protein F4Z17_12270 [Acidimicrobiia bacterium]|nr:hypothetical protein [Acidimicrobiia bacterium]